MKTFSQLTINEVKILKDTGLLWEIYPEAKDLFAKPGVSINRYNCWVCKEEKDGDPAYTSNAVNGTFHYCAACWGKGLRDVIKDDTSKYYKPMPESEKRFLNTGQNFCKPKNELETCCQNGSFNDGHECAKQPAYNATLVENIIHRYVNHYEYWQPKVHIREVLKQAVEEALRSVKAIPYSPPTAQAEPSTDSKWKKSALELGEIVKCFNTNRCYEPALKRLALCSEIAYETPMSKCPRCGGTGYWKPTSQDANLTVRCPDCNADGQVNPPK